MSFPISRATSPTSLVPFRFGRSDNLQPAKGRDHSPDIFSEGRVRRSSTQSGTNYKGKEPANGNGTANGYTNGSNSTSFGMNDTFSSSRYKPSSLTSYEASRPATADATTTRKSRGSILIAASDALGFKFGRRRQSIRQPPMPIILPDVIEISAPRRDEEVEERNRLKDLAAQSIGLPVMVQPDTRSRDESIEEADEESEEHGPSSGPPDPESRDLPDGRPAEAAFSSVSKFAQGSSVSIPMSSSAVRNRYRSDSLAHSRTSSVTLSPVPPFPTTVNALNQFQQSATMLFKFYSPSSLRIFALSKNWRSRFMVMSSPTALITRASGPPVSYLHLFKSSNGDEKEIERLEINEDSVVFVAEGDVGGRGHVVKVGGADVGALKKELNQEEGGRTMWFLQITDPGEAQTWITIIKTAILGQRTMRAGLGLPSSTLGGVEPRGDMDVMLSMRAQGIITSPTVAQRSGQNTPQTASQPDRNYASSISSHRSQATLSRSPSSVAVSTLKGLFTGSTRPRSASRATSIDSQQDRDPHEDSFGSMGSHLLGSIRPSTADPTANFQPGATHTSLPYAGSILSLEHRLERKIVTDRPAIWTSTETVAPVAPKERANRALSLGALSLQPPPRKRWTSIGPGSPDSTINNEASPSNGAVVLEKAETEPPSSPNLAGFSFGTPEQRPRAPSIQSVSTLASGDHTLSVERSSSSTKRSSVKRWSRQGVLPRRLTPPSGPPPLVPNSQTSANGLRPNAHPYSADRPPSQASSIHSAASQKSIVSSLPSFSKRASGSSVLSVTPPSISPSPSASRPTSTHSHRMSIPPPPRPAPTFALPPAPDQEGPKSDPFPSSKPSFRDSVAHRAFRLSMIAPKPPPSTVLPPRPDELDSRSHRRNSSAGSYSHPTSLDSIPASPVPPALTVSPFPPPLGPLPPTPLSSSPPPIASAPPSRPASRHLSIKQRLRILSAPSPAFVSASSPPTNPTASGPSTPLTATTPMPIAAPIPVSPPQTPIAEKITLYQNDLSFLQLHTPVTPYLPPPRALPTPPEPYPEVTSLSPPPRRGSKQISVIESEPVVEDEKPPVEGGHRLMSLSRPGSVISLGIVSM
ncbi:hypothetical protein Hypma_000928 [Hypsizygus marmoreus]|uniref:PH domain-containing protein n=1 Tax=Hypsizygus marmoreus TaxID=39966 RepID=A0A369J995_HYPMA|nr:hypothetical protein Hypma_000928 [Hypsizygus marmoreus]